MSMISVARALVQPQYSIESLLLALFRDEFIAWSKVSIIIISIRYEKYLFLLSQRKQEEADGHFISLADVSSDSVTPFVNDAVDITLTRLFSKRKKG